MIADYQGKVKASLPNCPNCWKNQSKTKKWWLKCFAVHLYWTGGLVIVVYEASEKEREREREKECESKRCCDKLWGLIEKDSQT